VTCDARPPAGQTEDRGPGLATADRPAADPRAEVQAVIEDVLGCRLDWDDPTMGFRLRPEWGSFEQVRILGRLQEVYGVGRFADDLTLLTTPRQILAAVTDRTPGDPAPATPGAPAGGADAAVEVDLGLARTVMDKTAITDIDPAGSRLCYRGHDVSALASSCSFDAVARLLIDGELAALDDDRRGLVAEGAFLARSAGLRWSGSHEDFVACFARLDLAGGQEESPDDVRRQGWRLLGAAAQLASRSADAPVPPDDSIAAQVAAPATGATDGPTDDVVAGLTALMILQADHGSSAAALAVRTAVSAGAGLHPALLAGLVTFGGHRHGGALADVVRLVEDIGDVDALGIAVRSSIERGVPVPGFGHRIYSVTDPRVEPIRRLLVRAEDRRRTVWWSERLRHIREAHAALERSGAVANVDFYAGPLLRTYGFQTESLTTLFAVARIAGWVAHAVEQTERRTLIRPKLEYVGARPEESRP
jgi:citrate synthase